MKIVFKITRRLLDHIHEDLSRPHGFACERVGFIACRAASLTGGHLLLASEYLPVRDEDYLDDAKYGAMMGPAAIRLALQHAYREEVAMIHVHRHEHRGKPGFSRVDVQENAKFVPDFFKVRPKLPHGAIVLSHDQLTGEVWEPGTLRRRPLSKVSVVGAPMFLAWS